MKNILRGATHNAVRLTIVSSMIAVASAGFASSQINIGFENGEGYVIPRAPFASYAADSVHEYPAGPGDNSWWVAPNSTPFANFDQAISTAAARTGSQGFQYSNSRSNGVIQQILSPKLNAPVGEPGTMASNGPASGNTRFIQDFWVKSATNTVERGNRFTMSGDDGNGGRMNWFGMEPTDGATPRYQFWLVDYVADSLDAGWAGAGEGNFRDVLLMDNVTPGTWYHVKIVTDIVAGRNNDMVKVYIGTSANLTEADLKGSGTTWEEYFRQGGELPVQQPNAINCTLIRSGATPQQWDGAANPTTSGFYFDDFRMQSTTTPNGFPVDLNGTYYAPSTAPNGGASATTFAQANQVSEISGGIATLDNTFTPFSDSAKRPTALSGLNLRGKSYSADVDLGDPTLWGVNAEFFQLGLGKNGGNVDGTAESFVSMYKVATGFRLFASSNFSADPAGLTLGYDASADETKFNVKVDINAAGTTATLAVTPLNGANAGNTTVLAPYTLAAGDVAETANASFFAGFVGRQAAWNCARATVSNFKTNATTNSMIPFAADPYNKSIENVDYAFMQANLNVPVGGFQAFLQSNTLTGLMNFVSGAYTTYPYPNHFSGAITAAGNLTGYIGFNAPVVQTDWTLANILMNGAHGTSGNISINPGGGTLDTQFNDFLGTAVAETRHTSNIALFDDVTPVVNGLSALQGPSNVLVAPGIQTGLLSLTVDAVDAWSGLKQQPTFAIDFAPLGAGPEDVTLQTFSINGNTFGAYYTVPANAPNGPAEIEVTGIDRAENAFTQVTPVNVNTATLTLNIQLQGFTATGPVTRGVDITLGDIAFPGTGSLAPVVLSRNVLFSNTGFATVVFTSADGLPNTSNYPTYAVGVKDPLHTLRTTSAVSGTGNQYTASATLRGGNLNLDHRIDIGDYVVYATRYGIPVNPNTPFPHAPTFRHADLDGDGDVDTADFSFFTPSAFGAIDDNPPGLHNRIDRTIRTRITVQDAIRESNSRTAANLDLNRDGVITMEEIQRYLSRQRS